MIRFSGHLRQEKDIFKRTHTIGIIASAPEIDTASASIAIANYYRSAKGYQTALAVMGEDSGIADMLKEMKCIDIDPPGYDDGKLTYYVLKDRNDLEKLVSKGIDRIVVDLGTDYGGYDSEDFFMIENMFALISAAPWRYRNTREFLFSTIISDKGLRQKFKNTLYSVTGTERMIRTIGEEFRIGIKSARELVQIADPCRLTKEDLRVLKSLV